VSEAAHEHPGPGWYLDPSGEHLRRWWNGSTWTDFVRDAPAEGVTSNGGGQEQSTQTWQLDLSEQPRGPWSNAEHWRDDHRDHAAPPTFVGPWVGTVTDPTQVVGATRPDAGEFDSLVEDDGWWVDHGRAGEFITEAWGSHHPLPGWYADPFGEHGVRWWDGNAWLPRQMDRTPAPISASAWRARVTRAVAPTTDRRGAAMYSLDPSERSGIGFPLGMIPVLMAFLAYSVWLFVHAGR
jgi:hypothetical protein